MAVPSLLTAHLARRTTDVTERWERKGKRMYGWLRARGTYGRGRAPYVRVTRSSGAVHRTV